MIITIEVNEDKWLLSIEGNYEGNNIKKRYRNKENIKNFILSLDNPIDVYNGINDMKLLYDDCALILKYYRKNKDNELYKYITSQFSPKTNIINIVKSNIQKIKNIAGRLVVNKKTFVALSTSLMLTGSVLKMSSDTDADVPFYVYSNIESENITAIPSETIQINYLEKQDEVKDFDISKYMSLDDRITEFRNLEIEKSNFKVGSKLDEYTFNKVIKFMEQNEDVYNEASLKYGVDPYLLLSFSLTESSLLHKQTLPGGKYYNGCAIGVTQIEEVHLGETLTAYNYKNNTYDSVKLTLDRLTDFVGNVETCAMMVQNSLDRYNNNIYIAIQAHNYGTSTMDIIIQKYADEIGKTFEEVTLDINDFGWLKYVDDVYKNPKKYFSNWKYDTYGNNQYISKVLGNYLGQNMVNNSFDNYYIYDLVCNTCELQSKSYNLEVVSNEFNKIR